MYVWPEFVVGAAHASQVMGPKNISQAVLLPPGVFPMLSTAVEIQMRLFVSATSSPCIYSLDALYSEGTISKVVVVNGRITVLRIAKRHALRRNSARRTLS